MIRVTIPAEVNAELQRIVAELDTPALTPRRPSPWADAVDVAMQRLESEFRTAWRRHIEFEKLRRELGLDESGFE